MNYGVVLMRAQPVHKGHIDIIKQALSENLRVLIVVGSANKSGTKRNPLPIEMRVHFLQNALCDYDLSTKVDVMTLPDWSKEDAYQYAKEWGNFFYYNVVAHIGTKTFTMYYNDDPATVKNWFNEIIAERVTVKSAVRKRDVSGTKIREACEKNDNTYLRWMLCPSTYGVLPVLKKMLLDCTEDDFIME